MPLGIYEISEETLKQTIVPYVKRKVKFYMSMVQNVSFSVNLCGMWFLQTNKFLFKVIATWLLNLVQLSMHHTLSGKIIQNSSFQNLKSLMSNYNKLLKHFFFKINKKSIVSFLIQRYSVFKISYEKYQINCGIHTSKH